MGLWQGRPGRERRDVRGRQGGRDGRRREKQRRKIKHVFKTFNFDLSLSEV